MKLLETMGGRKFSFAVGVVLIFFILTLAGKTDPDHLESICIWALAIFSVANVGQKVIK